MNPQQNPVPRLDLDPKLKRTLYLLNPLDYLRLLYWVFYFPQALRWYIETFGNKKTIKRQLILQGLALTVVGVMFFYGLWTQIEIPVYGLGVGMGVAVGIAVNMRLIQPKIIGLLLPFGVGFSALLLFKFPVVFTLGVYVAFFVVLGLLFCLWSGWRYILGGDDTIMARKLLFNAFIGIVIGILLGIIGAFLLWIGWDLLLGWILLLVPIALLIGAFRRQWPIGLSVLLGIGFNALLNNVELDATSAVGFILGLGGGLFRIDNWLFSVFIAPLKPWNRGWVCFHLTTLPIPSLTFQVTTWLRQDWQTGVHNVNQLLAYTLQSKSVIAAVNQVLDETPPDEIIWRVAQLAENPFDWKLLRLIAPDSSLHPLFHAVTLGFWYLHQQKPEKAAEAFTVVRELRYGEEMYRLAETLAVFSQSQDPHTIALSPELQALNLTFLPSRFRLRPANWQVITRLYNVLYEVRKIQKTSSRNTLFLALNRAQGELQTILDHKENLPQAERQLIIDIAETWQKALLTIAGEVGKITITEPVKIPYVIGNPVEGSLFVGREDILRQLEELWIEANRLQSVVLFGHRRMGKTSILKNVNACLGDGVKLAYVNLLDVGNNQEGVGEVLMAICDEVAEIVNISSPEDEDLLKLPYPTFRRFLKQVEKVLTESPQTPPLPPLPPKSGGSQSNKDLLTDEQYLKYPNFGGFRGLSNEGSPQTDGVGKEGLREESHDNSLDHEAEESPPSPPFKRGGENPQTLLKKEGKGLIIALDELEVIEYLIHAGKIDKGFMGMLRARVQGSSKIAFAFAGLHNLEEMNSNYFHPFFSSMINIKVGFLSRGSTRQLLANPDEDFLLDYEPEALDFIYDLTFGQPFLVQLVGFQLVRRYNQQVFETGKPRDPLFTVADVAGAIDDPEFYQRGRHYFTGVWGQAEQDVPGQQEILKVLAPQKIGLPLDILGQVTGMDEATLSAALDSLRRHDVVAEKSENWRIVVELFRRWMIRELEKKT